MTKDELLTALWGKYTQMTPSASQIHQLFESRGETIINDHIAFRTFNDPRINLDVIAAPFKELGYVSKGDYEFKEKKLFAHHYEIPGDETAPKIFISELLLEQCSAEVQTIITNALDKIDFEAADLNALLLQGRLWNIDFNAYEKLRKESEYASWMYIFGFCPNHFTIFVNKLKTIKSLEEVNEIVKSAGFRLNDSGGEIKGSPDQLLEQSSTLADQVAIQFPEGEKFVPSCYYEFARRYTMPDGNLYQGFIAASADKIFESTNVSLAEKAKRQ